jgi:hypothetical protein
MGVDANGFGFIKGLNPLAIIHYEAQHSGGLVVNAPQGLGQTNNVFTITDTVNNRVGPRTTVFGGNGDTFNVQGTHGQLTIDAAFAKDTINIGSSSNPLLSTLDTIQGAVIVNGQGGNTTVNAFDQGSKTPHSYVTSISSLGHTLTRTPGPTAPITVNFAPPPIVFKGPEIKPAQAKDLKLTPSAQVGQAATLSGQLVDLDPAAKLELTVNWGDGSKPQLLKPGQEPFSLQHQYHKAGTYKVHVTWTDLGTGLSNSQDLTIQVKPHGGHGDHDDR